jgi:hypothetical protein
MHGVIGLFTVDNLIDPPFEILPDVDTTMKLK